jgi:hypothetical protein
MASTFDWRSLIPQAVALGSKALGDKLAPGADLQNAQTNRMNSQEQARQFDINQRMKQAQMNQSNQIRQNLMPGMYTNLGYDPGTAKKMAAQYGTLTTRGGQGGAGMLGQSPYAPQGGAQPQGPGLGAKFANAGLGLAPTIVGGLMKGGAAGAGGLGSSIVPFLTNPWTVGIGAGIAAVALAKKLIGRGRKQANKLTDPGGMQYQFNQDLAEITAAQDSGEITQQEREGLIRQLYAQLQQDANQFAGGGDKQRLVTDQMRTHYTRDNPVTNSALRGY